MRIQFSFPCGLELVRFTQELRETLGGGYVQKIHQTPSNVFSFRVHRPGWTGWLIFSGRGELPCLTIGEDRAREPQAGKKVAEPPPLCRLLRRDVEGKGITSVEQAGRDRVIILEMTDGRRIVFEILGQFANLIGVGAGGEVEHCLRKEARRPVEPGVVYTPPGRGGKLAPDSPEADAFLDKVAAGSRAGEQVEVSDMSVREICSKIAGVSPLLAREILHRAAADGVRGAESLRSIRGEIEHQDGRGFAFRDAGGTIACASPVRMRHLETTHSVEEYSTFLDSLRCWYEEADSLLGREHIRGRLLAPLREERKRVWRDMAAAERDRKEGEREEELRLAAEMLLAQPHRARKGMREVELENLYDPEKSPLTVVLDPLLDPRQNAARYFDRAGKARRKREQSRQRREELSARLETLDAMISRVEEAEDVSELEDLRTGVEDAAGRPAGIEGKSKKKGREKDPVAGIARVYRTGGGYTIYVARGAREGDELLRRVAKGSDLWLHTRDVPGSHVVIRGPSGEAGVPQETLLDAAHLAAHFSKARGEKVVPLHMTEVKHLRRPRGGKPGKVIIGKERTFTLRVEEERLSCLLGKKM